MKILYAGQLSENDSALYRLWALERLGHTVVRLDSLAYQPQQSLLRKLVHRVQAGPWVTRLNADLLSLAASEQPQIFWADKLLGLRPATLERLREAGIATISYMIDNAFGPRRDPGWRLYRQCIPAFALHVVQRERNLADYQAAGARDVIKIQTAFEPTLHFPPPAACTQPHHTRGVSFVGTPYDDRADFLTRLWREGVPVTVSGAPVWRDRLCRKAADAIYTGGALYGAAYREAIWASAINLSFLTHSNQDEFAHKSFEIAACGGFLLAERSEGHAARFVEGEQAEFFSGYDECLAKIRRYLPDAKARAKIAAAGRARAVASGYDNDAQMARVIHRASLLGWQNADQSRVSLVIERRGR